jgi:flagellar hook-basal body complex protein FliE
MLLSGLGEVSQLDQDAQSLSVQAVLDPESVDAHDVTIAAAKAELALSITKNIVDRVIEAYREIQNIR